MQRHTLLFWLLAVTIGLLMAGCHKQTAPVAPSPSASGTMAQSHVHTTPQTQQVMQTRINGIRAAARQRAQMMHNHSGKP